MLCRLSPSFQRSSSQLDTYHRIKTTIELINHPLREICREKESTLAGLALDSFQNPLISLSNLQRKRYCLPIATFWPFVRGREFVELLLYYMYVCMVFVCERVALCEGEKWVVRNIYLDNRLASCSPTYSQIITRPDNHTV